MILIDKIEFINIDADQIELAHYKEPDYPFLVGTEHGEDIKTASVIRELVKGRRFRRSDGTDVVIGHSKDTGDILGLSYEAFDNLEELLSITQDTVWEEKQKCAYEKAHAEKLSTQVYALETMSRWEHLKKVFN